jgi:DNA-binding MarR family transcriptional regulator
MTPAGQHRIFHLLQLAAHKVKTRGDRDAQAIAGITAAQAAVLFVVRASGGATTQMAVAKQLKQQESAVTAMVSRLLDAGLLTREPSRADRRAWTLRVTPKAEDALRRFRRPLDALNARITKAVGGAAEVDTLARALKNIIDEV